MAVGLRNILAGTDIIAAEMTGLDGSGQAALDASLRRLL
jgi:hypothetical protein